MAHIIQNKTIYNQTLTISSRTCVNNVTFINSYIVSENVSNILIKDCHFKQFTKQSSGLGAIQIVKGNKIKIVSNTIIKPALAKLPKNKDPEIVKQLEKAFKNHPPSPI